MKPSPSASSSSSSSSASEEETPKGPIHLLMVAPANSDTKRTKPASHNHSFTARLYASHFQNDYVSKRAKAYRQTADDAAKNRTSEVDPPWWEGVSPLERKLIACCEKKHSSTSVLWEVSEEEDDDDDKPGGALDRKEEVRFLALLSKDCQNMASRSLALAILERTLETHWAELEEEDDPDEDEESGDEEVEEDDDNTDLDSVPSDDENDDDWKPGMRRRQSPRFRKRKRRKSNNEGGESKPNGNKKGMESGQAEDDHDVGRLERFLAAGGLKILNRWLVEASASTPTNTATLKAPPLASKQAAASVDTNSTTSIESNSTRPLILPILRVLEHIPFDKKCVVESKINKQIRNIGKEVKRILEAWARNEHAPEDLQGWTTQPTTSDTEALDDVQEAVDAVKKSWEEKAKKKAAETAPKFADPLQRVKDQLRDRLESIREFHAGAIPQPDWLELPDESKKENAVSTKNPHKKSTMQEMAARERKAEREELQKRLRAVENEHRERLAKLREQLQKRQEETPLLPSRTPAVNGGKKVVWKDGGKSQILRNRRLLEEVFVYAKTTSANGTDVEDGNGVDEMALGGDPSLL